MEKYYKNFILCSDVDFYCLLCQAPFRFLHEVEKHLMEQKHKNLLKNQNYYPKFIKDAIYQIETNYYCEVCNYLAPNLDNLQKHIVHDIHKTQLANPCSIERSEPLAKRIGIGDVAIGKVAVCNRKHWNGVRYEHCLFCDTDVKEFDHHAALPSHMLKFIQAKLVEVPGKTKKDAKIYRKINEDTFYCFTCYKTFSAEHLNSHWTEVHDETELKKKLNGEPIKMLFNIDVANDVGICILCQETCEGFLQVTSHRDEHISKKEWEYDALEINQTFMEMEIQDKGKQRSYLKKFGKENFIQMVENGSKGYCTLCHLYISAHIRCFKGHVNGFRHSNCLEIKGLKDKTKNIEKPDYETILLKNYRKDLIFLKNHAVFLIPDAEVCIDLMSFSFINQLNNKTNQFTCYLCDGVYSDDPIEHLGSDHRYKLAETKVVKIKDEFIREIRPNIYHCGVCNIILPGWPFLQKHLAILKHRYMRAVAHSKVEDYVDPELFALLL